jgi:hypothetical protein
MDIGNGAKEAHADLGDSVIQIPDKYIFQPIGCDPITSFIQWCYPIANEPNMASKAILTPKNSDVDKINDIALDRMQGSIFSLPSADSVDIQDSENERDFFPIEFLNCPVYHLIILT